MLSRLVQPRPKNTEARTAAVMGRVPAPIAQALDEYSAAQRASRTAVLIAAIEEFLDDHAPDLIDKARRHPSMRRPPTRQTGPAVTLPGLRVPIELEHRFVAHAKERGITKSELMRRSLERYLIDEAEQAGPLSA